MERRLALMPHSQMLPGEACILVASVLVTSFLYVSPAESWRPVQGVAPLSPTGSWRRDPLKGKEIEDGWMMDDWMDDKRASQLKPLHSTI